MSTNFNCLGLVNGYDVGWTSGSTEPGSSGSGLFTSNGHYLVGVAKLRASSAHVQ